LDYDEKVVIFTVLSACGELVAIITPDLRIIAQTFKLDPPSFKDENLEEGGVQLKGIPLISSTQISCANTENYLNYMS
jgi:hypothetical protein